MKYYVVCDAAGEIVRSGVCQDEDLGGGGLQADWTWLEGVGSNATHYVHAGGILAYTPEQAASKAQRPMHPCRWDNVTGAWVDLRTLVQLKAAHWAGMKAARDAHEFGGFEWDGSTFDSDRESQARIMGAVQMAVLAMSAQQSFEIAWTLADNAVRTLAGADMIAVGLELGAHVAATHAIGRTLRAAIEDAADAAEVEAVQWP